MRKCCFCEENSLTTNMPFVVCKNNNCCMFNFNYIKNKGNIEIRYLNYVFYYPAKLVFPLIENVGYYRENSNRFEDISIIDSIRSIEDMIYFFKSGTHKVLLAFQ